MSAVRGGLKRLKPLELLRVERERTAGGDTRSGDLGLIDEGVMRLRL
jgi:hypothetical protein